MMSTIERGAELGQICHCGNPTEKLVGGHCLLCRCDEHGNALESTVMPGCGPRCVHHSPIVQWDRWMDLLERTFEKMPQSYTPARTYHPWSEIRQRTGVAA